MLRNSPFFIVISGIQSIAAVGPPAARFYVSHVPENSKLRNTGRERYPRIS
jgi:hypothetical protein